MELLSVSVYWRHILEDLHIQHQLKASDTLPNREALSYLGHSQHLHRNITGIIFETLPFLPHPYFPCTRIIKSKPRLETQKRIYFPLSVAQSIQLSTFEKTARD